MVNHTVKQTNETPQPSGLGTLGMDSFNRLEAANTLSQANVSQRAAIDRTLGELEKTLSLTAERRSSGYIRLNDASGRTIATYLERGNGAELQVAPGSESRVREILAAQNVFAIECIGAEDGFASGASTRVGATFKMSPKLTSDEIQNLRTPAKVVEGTKVVVQGEWTTLNPDSPYDRVGTFGIGPCRGIIIRNRETGNAVVAHLDQEASDMDFIKRGIRQVGGDPSKIEILSTNNLDPQIVGVMRSEGFKVSTTLGTNFTIDKSGNIAEVSQSVTDKLKDDPTMRVRLNNMEIRLKNGIPFVQV